MIIGIYSALELSYSPARICWILALSSSISALWTVGLPSLVICSDIWASSWFFLPANLLDMTANQANRAARPRPVMCLAWSGNFWVVVIVNSWVNFQTWLLIGCLLLCNQSGAISVYWPSSWLWLELKSFHPCSCTRWSMHLVSASDKKIQCGATFATRPFRTLDSSSQTWAAALPKWRITWKENWPL